MRHPSARFAFLQGPRPLLFAHRGGTERHEGNTLAAFADAAGLGFRIETDVRATRDGVAVIAHDDALASLTGDPGRVSDHAWSDLARLRMPRGEGVARLDDALSALPRTPFNLDAKCDAAVAPMAEAVRRCGATARVCAASFDGRRTGRLRRLLGPDLCWSAGRWGVAAAWLAGWGPPAPAPAAPALQVPARWHGVPVATPRVLAAAHARGAQLHVWTVNEEAEMDRLLDIGVDGLITDRPRLLRRVLERRGSRSEER